MIFDALVGETDRHAENWGVITDINGYRISPLYDNGDNLLRDFKNSNLAEKYYNGTKDFDSYIKRPQSLIYKDNHTKRYKLDELIKELYKKYPRQIKQEILNLKKLTPNKIEKIVNKIPDNLLTEKYNKCYRCCKYKIAVE